ncbi:hypothetical protein PL18_03530 [Vibrio renipiscarius]|uniref:Uncharacterized protein n=1 Tax=Vibrio renipiscarius TaxID=1461322 RepID=A0A0C2KG83_9VIBR|nr:hypothetical protein OJ16_03005 [Vibrio renipiscarius]KII81650.1 hypothetical protein PL18_03530 [Vibrio renipiscarius]
MKHLNQKQSSKQKCITVCQSVLAEIVTLFISSAVLYCCAAISWNNRAIISPESYGAIEKIGAVRWAWQHNLSDNMSLFYQVTQRTLL